jgi:hypothetical protein
MTTIQPSIIQSSSQKKGTKGKKHNIAASSISTNLNIFIISEERIITTTSNY